jgi:hypothetical protein
MGEVLTLTIESASNEDGHEAESLLKKALKTSAFLTLNKVTLIEVEVTLIEVTTTVTIFSTALPARRVAVPCPESRHSDSDSDSELTGGAAGVLAHATYRPDEKVGGPAPLFYVASSFITSLMCY